VFERLFCCCIFAVPFIYLYVAPLFLGFSFFFGTSKQLNQWIHQTINVKEGSLLFGKGVLAFYKKTRRLKSKDLTVTIIERSFRS
jgi:hypothetical protein